MTAAAKTAPIADPQPITGPALSATSDEPRAAAIAPALSAQHTSKDQPQESVELAEAQAAANAAKAAEEAAAVETPAAEGETETPQTTEAKSFEDLPAWAKRELTKARNAKRAAETRATETEANLKSALTALEKSGGDKASETLKVTEANDPKPVREKFDTPEAHEAALIEWSSRRAAQATAAKIEAEQAKTRKTEDQKATEARNRATVEAYESRKDKFIKDHPDFEDVVENDEIQISTPMSHAILTSEDGPAMAYYLGQNPDEASRISKLDPINAVYEMGRISARLNAKPKPSTKPAPITPLKTGSATATKVPETTAEYCTRRTQEMRAEKLARFNGASAH